MEEHASSRSEEKILPHTCCRYNCRKEGYILLQVTSSSFVQRPVKFCNATWQLFLTLTIRWTSHRLLKPHTVTTTTTRNHNQNQHHHHHHHHHHVHDHTSQECTSHRLLKPHTVTTTTTRNHNQNQHHHRHHHHVHDHTSQECTSHRLLKPHTVTTTTTRNHNQNQHHHHHHHHHVHDHTSQECTSPERRVAVATKFCTIAPSICGSSARNLLHVNLLAPRILK